MIMNVQHSLGCFSTDGREVKMRNIRRTCEIRKERAKCAKNTHVHVASVPAPV
jgi:hypothetical protein